MKKIVLLLFVGGLALLVIQNWGPTLPLVVFGSQTIALPAAAWIFGAIAAGLLTSAVLQILNYRPQSSSLPSEPAVASSRRRDREEPRFDRSQTPLDSSGWETGGVDSDWETSQVGSTKKASRPPAKPTIPKRQWDAETRSNSTTKSDTDPLPKPEPPIATRKQDSVYDADYRVIAPPYPEPNASTNQEDEEDWGFDDDELESEYRRSYRNPSGDS